MVQNTLCIKEHEIDTKALLWKILLKWKLVLLIACIFALLGYGYAKYKQKELMNMGYSNSSEQSEDYSNEELIDYDMAKDNILVTVHQYESALKNEREYIDSSTMMKIDPYHVYSTTQEFEIRAKGKVNINELSMIGRQLANSAVSSDLTTQLADEYGIDPQYIRELISSGVRNNQYDTGVGRSESGLMADDFQIIEEDEDIENYYFYINAKSNDRQLTIDMVQRMSEYVQQKAEGIISIKCTLTPLTTITYESVDTSLISTQNDSRVRAYDYSDRLVKLNTMLDNLEKSQANSLMKTEPVGGISTKKYIVMGFAGGALLVLVILFLSNILTSRFQTESDFRSWFMINILGAAPVYDGKLKRGLKKSILEKMEGSSIRLSEDDFYEMVCANIVNVVLESKAVLVTGSVEQAFMRELENKLMPLLREKCENTEFIFAENILNNPKTRSYLQTIDSTILVEKRSFSKVEEVREEIEVITSLNKRILGAILL